MDSETVLGSGECLDEEWVERWLDRRLTSSQRVAAEGHLDGCDACRRWVSEAVRDRCASTSEPELASTDGERPAAAVASVQALRRGSLVGRYVVLDALGAGGMGRVFLAYDPELERRVAVKLLRPDAEGLDRELLLREGRVLARLAHPHVVSVFDMGTLGDQLYVTLEYIEGETLDGWLASGSRSLRQVLELFWQAGQGLLAAHEAGLVHRDFKPANVLVGKQGRVCVSDFGLARPAAELSPGVEATAVLSTVAGTPAYMAPEQFRGAAPDARSDQFSFCVALFEALCGRRPFELQPGGPRVAPLTRAPTLRGGSRMPGRLWRALAQGLSADPAARHPSMRALLERLNPHRRGRRWSIAVGAGLAIALTVVAAVQLLARGQVCRVAAEDAQGAFGADLRSQVQAAFHRSGRSFAKDALERVEATLDAYQQGLFAEQQRACEATRIRGELPESVLVLRKVCLERRGRELQALAQQLAQADGPMVERAVEMVQSLVPVGRCADLEELTSPTPLPSSEADRARATALQKTLAEALALESAGKYAQGLPVAERAVEEAKELGHRPLLAEAQFQLGRLQASAGRPKDAAQTFKHALWSAEAGGADGTAARVLVELVLVHGFALAAPERAHDWAREADAFLERRRGDDALRARLLTHEGQVFQQEGKHDAAISLLREAVGLAERPPSDPLTHAQAANTLAVALRTHGQHEAALPWAQRAAELRERALGPEHPQTATSLSTQANILSLLRRYPEAIALHRRALEVRRRALGEAHPDVGGSLMNLGSTLSASGSYAEALAFLEQALANWKSSKGPTHPHVASALNSATNTCEQLGRYEQGRAYAREGLAIREKAFGPDHVDVAQTLINLGSIELAAGNPKAALPAFERALVIREKALGAKNPELARELFGAAQARAALKDRGGAYLLLERALELHQLGNLDALLGANIRFELAQQLAQRRDLARAKALAEQAYQGLGTSLPVEKNLRERVGRFLETHR